MQKADLKRLRVGRTQGAGGCWGGWAQGSAGPMVPVIVRRQYTVFGMQPLKGNLSLFFFKQEVVLRKFHFYEWNQRINSEADPAMIRGLNRVM